MLDTLSEQWRLDHPDPDTLATLAEIVASRDAFELAAKMLGANEQLRQSVGSVAQPLDQRELEQTQSKVRAALGDEQYDRNRRDGMEMSHVDIIQLVQAEVTHILQAEKERKEGVLSVREREVVTLIARGLSNREIATTLSISDRTAESHVQHVLDKLGFRSRTQIATWVERRRITGTNQAVIAFPGEPGHL